MSSSLYRTFKQWEKSLEGRNKALWEMLRFLILFTVAVLPLYTVSWIGWNPIWLRTLHATTAATILDLIGIGAEQIGTTITTDVLIVDVSTDSTGWKSVLAVTGLIVAYRHRTWQSKSIGIGLGAIAIAGINQLRLVSMVVAVTWYSVPYEVIHTVLWRWGMTISVVACWLGWIAMTETHATDSS